MQGRILIKSRIKDQTRQYRHPCASCKIKGKCFRGRELKYNSCRVAQTAEVSSLSISFSEKYAKPPFISHLYSHSTPLPSLYALRLGYLIPDLKCGQVENLTRWVKCVFRVIHTVIIDQRQWNKLIKFHKNLNLFLLRHYFPIWSNTFDPEMTSLSRHGENKWWKAHS